ncbi:class I SAM-dependent methyltransferase [Ruegeria atlantica]|uniref:class I SAM-dependent methyltransferase n=1 Tax=Ruegeria atlantica TaxID=81569 RepID=UPI00147E90BD|nr:class I SAM-dependent methyltransferase [Ruegeria atlantica]
MSRFSSTEYWIDRYAQGKNSGAGSYGRLSVYKANFINTFVEAEGIHSVVELGSGDGNQASLFDIAQFTGLDVSEDCVRNCSARFANRPGWTFLKADAEVEAHDAALSLDVVYHLVEDDVFEAYMHRLFSLAKRYVVIYASDFDLTPSARHVRHRAFSKWIADRMPNWKLYCEETNPFNRDGHGNSRRHSFASFKVFEKVKDGD